MAVPIRSLVHRRSLGVYERAPFEWGQISFDITGIEFGIPEDDDHEV